MRTPSRSLAAALLAAAVLGALAATAGAYTVSAEPAGRISSASLGKVTFTTEAASIQCNLTLGGTLAAGPVELVAGRPLGSVTEARWANCEGGEIGRFLSLPWSLTVNSTAGTLPNQLTGLLVSLREVHFNLSIFFGLVNCLYQGDAGGLISLSTTASAGVYTSGLITALSSPSLPYHSGPEACPGSGRLRGTFGLSPSQRFTVSPHEFRVEPARATAEGTIELEAEGWSASCTTEVSFEFETSPIPLTSGAKMGTPIGGAVECVTAEEVHIEARYLEWGWMEYHTSLIDRNGRFTGALNIWKVAVLITMEPRQKCLFEEIAEVLMGITGPTFLGNPIALKQDLGAGRSCPGWIRIRGRLMTILELRFI